ncbi:hypothetical protein SDC9_155493 [bioreactor metagenome]|uniref:Uncharacterized protein n=1 Tax=bioreactor metagenome TaxID=1076179 RepID=A0A645F1Q0_9ZZZZ
MRPVAAPADVHARPQTDMLQRAQSFDVVFVVNGLFHEILLVVASFQCNPGSVIFQGKTAIFDRGKCRNFPENTHPELVKNGNDAILEDGVPWRTRQ